MNLVNGRNQMSEPLIDRCVREIAESFDDETIFKMYCAYEKKDPDRIASFLSQQPPGSRAQAVMRDCVLQFICDRVHKMVVDGVGAEVLEAFFT